VSGDLSATSNPAHRSAFFVKEDPKGELYFWTRENWIGNVPDDQRSLMDELDAACAVLRARLATRSPAQYERAFKQLLDLARASFGGEYAQVEQGRKSLEAFKARMVRQEGPTIKNEYLGKFALYALYASILIMICSAAIRGCFYYADTQGWVTKEVVDEKAVSTVLQSVRLDPRFSVIHFGLLLSSVMWGVWVSFYFRNENWKFEQIEHPEADLAKPWARLLAHGLVAFMLALFFHMGVIVVSVGGISTSQFSQNATIALFVGLGLGFLDQTLASEVYRRYQEFFQQAKPGTSN
jgi:hypothetical protein